MARFKTPWTVDAFHTGVEGLVITPAGTDVPDEHADAVQAAAAHNGVTLIELAPAGTQQAAVVTQPLAGPSVEEFGPVPADPSSHIEEAGA